MHIRRPVPRLRKKLETMTILKNAIKYFTVCNILGHKWTHMSNGYSCCRRCTALEVTR